MILSTTTKCITFFTEKKTVGPINLYIFFLDFLIYYDDAN